MNKKLTINGIEYMVQECTAIAMCDVEEASDINRKEAEARRQNALLVTSEINGETFINVVFGYNMPDNEDDFNEISEDSEAWESDEIVISTAFTNISEEAENLDVDATNFESLRDVFEENHPRMDFLDYLSDEQLVRIARTSDNYEFDEMFGIISEVLDRTETEVPEELKEGEYQEIYEEALDKLERKDIISKSIETFYKKHGFVCALEVDETERILNLWEKSLEDDEFEEFFEANYNSLIREFAKEKSLKHFRLRQADDFYGNEIQTMIDFIRENHLLEEFEENELKECDYV